MNEETTLKTSVSVALSAAEKLLSEQTEKSEEVAKNIVIAAFKEYEKSKGKSDAEIELGIKDNAANIDKLAKEGVEALIEALRGLAVEPSPYFESSTSAKVAVAPGILASASAGVSTGATR